MPCTHIHQPCAEDLMGYQQGGSVPSVDPMVAAKSLTPAVTPLYPPRPCRFGVRGRSRSIFDVLIHNE